MGEARKIVKIATDYNKKSCNKNAMKNTEMLEKYIYCMPIKKIIKVF
jgi:hypothetical protein